MHQHFQYFTKVEKVYQLFRDLLIIREFRFVLFHPKNQKQLFYLFIRFVSKGSRNHNIRLS
jgi:hypothetical protein